MEKIVYINSTDRDTKIIDKTTEGKILTEDWITETEKYLIFKDKKELITNLEMVNKINEICVKIGITGL